MPSKKIKVLHLASFKGNIGDVLNHDGFYRGLRDQGIRFEVSQLEIREFYRKHQFFDENFVELVNRYDLLVVGGGNYFELWVDHSPTGTSFMLPVHLFEKIRVPVIFNALGVDPGQGAKESNVNRFREFLDSAFSRSDVLASVRNDGSMKALGEYVGTLYQSRFLWTPDAGFNADFSGSKPNSRRMIVNLAGDMLDTRFDKDIQIRHFYEQFGTVIQHLVTDGQIDEVVLIPHIFRDLELISGLMAHLPDWLSRGHVVVGELGTNLDRFKSYYASSDLTLANRFHSNIAGIASGCPTIGLLNYRQIGELYAELGLKDQVIDIRDSDFSSDLIRLVATVKSEKSRDQQFSIAEQQRKSYAEYMCALKGFVERIM